MKTHVLIALLLVGLFLYLNVGILGDPSHAGPGASAFKIMLLGFDGLDVARRSLPPAWKRGPVRAIMGGCPGMGVSVADGRANISEVRVAWRATGGNGGNGVCVAR